MHARRKWLLVLLGAFLTQAPLADQILLEEPKSQDLRAILDRRVRIQSAALKPGWHEGLFVHWRREPPCYGVMVWKPRSSPNSGLQLESIIELKALSALQAYSGPQTPWISWAGRQSSELFDDSLWRPVPRAVADAHRECPAGSSSR